MSEFNESRARSLAAAAVADPENASCESDMEEAIVDLLREFFNAGMDRAASIVDSQPVHSDFPMGWDVSKLMSDKIRAGIEK